MKTISVAAKTGKRICKSIARARAKFWVSNINLGWAEDKGYSFANIVAGETKAAGSGSVLKRVKSNRQACRSTTGNSH